MTHKQPTEDQAHAIAAVLDATTYGGNGSDKWINWGTPENKARARELCHALTGYRPSLPNCVACEYRVMDLLRVAIGLPATSAPVDETKYASRIAICRVCPIYNHTTHSCGTLIVDALRKREVTVDGTTFAPCGCSIPVAARIKWHHCPAGKW